MRIVGEHLTCIRGDRLVFVGVDFALDRGQALLLRGPNGSGKTSLLRICAGLLPPAEGRLTVDGRAVAEDPEAFAATLQFVGHLDPLKPVLTVAENLRFWMRLSGGGGEVGAALARFGLAGLADLPARYLSAGQRRRANLARLAATPAALWLLDEPTTALDEQSTRALAELVAEHRAGGGMVMAATHIELDMPGAADLRLGSTAAGGR